MLPEVTRAILTIRMLSKNTKFYSLILLGADFIALLAAFGLAYVVRVLLDTRNLLTAHGGDPGKVVKWADDDFDSFDIVTIDWSGGHATFERATQGLTGLGDECPG